MQINHTFAVDFGKLLKLLYEILKKIASSL